MGRLAIAFGLGLVTAAVTGGTAAARPSYLDHDWRLEGGFGFRAGSQTVDGTHVDFGDPIVVEGGVRQNRLYVFGEYSIAEMTFPYSGNVQALGKANGATGLMQRVGATAQYSFSRAGERDGGIDLYAEGGVGWEHLQWDEGGVMTRPDLALGLGTNMWGAGRHKHGGLSMGVRVQLSPRNDVNAGAPSTCAGPCDYATPPSKWDRSILFDMTVHFGR